MKYKLLLNTGEKCLLRVSDISLHEQKKAEFEVARQIYALGVSMPQPLECSVTKDSKQVYTLLEWAEGRTLDTCISSMEPKRQYNLGIQAGEVLQQIHQCSLPTVAESWEKRYFDVMEERIEYYRKEGIPFEGSETILQYLRDNRYLLAERPQCRHHGDFHMGNMIVNDKDELQIIDWHTVDFKNIGDPWYEFNRLGFEYPAFAAGQVDGYFGLPIPVTSFVASDA